jgi:hypothetical protein
LKSDGARLLRSAALDLDVGQDFEEHLTKVYFSWHNSCHPVVDESMYWSSKSQREENEEGSGFCSEVLTNAMYVLLIFAQTLSAQYVTGVPSVPAMKHGTTLS